MCAFVLGAAALATRSDDAVSGVLVCGPGARNAIVRGTTIAEHRPEGEGGTDRGAPGWLIRSIAHRILQGGETLARTCCAPVSARAARAGQRIVFAGGPCMEEGCTVWDRKGRMK